MTTRVALLCHYRAGDVVELIPAFARPLWGQGPGAPPMVGFILAVDPARPDRRPYHLDLGAMLAPVWIAEYWINYTLARCRPEETNGTV